MWVCFFLIRLSGNDGTRDLLPRALAVTITRRARTGLDHVADMQHFPLEAQISRGGAKFEFCDPSSGRIGLNHAADMLRISHQF